MAVQNDSEAAFSGSGARDVGSFGVMDIYNHVVFVTDAVPDVPGRRLLMRETGHSISDERPRHLAEQIVDFLPLPPPRRTDISFLAALLLAPESPNDD